MKFFLVICCAMSALFASDFDELMGSKTKHWTHVKLSEDIEALSLFRALFEKNHPLVLSAQGSVKIPKVVHFIWLGPRPFPPQSVANVRTWIAQNPDWKFKFWTDRPRDPPCNGMEVIVMDTYPFSCLEKCFEMSTNWGEKSDILRYEILLSEGGIYADHDANCLVPFTPYNQTYDFMCGLETPHPPFAGRNITVGMGLLGARAGHPVIRKVVELIRDRWDRLETKFAEYPHLPREQLVMERTYMALTDALPSTVGQEGMIDIVFPASHFFPKKGLKPLLSKHFFANSWAGESPEKREKEQATTHRSVEKIESRLHQLTLVLPIALSLNLLLFFFGVFCIRKLKVSK